MISKKKRVCPPKIVFNAIEIDFDATEDEPIAQFSIGECWANHRISVCYTTTSVQLGEVSEKVCLETDEEAQFEVPIPLQTTIIDITVAILRRDCCTGISKNCDDKVWCCKFGNTFVSPQSSP